jgi:hypothetical protein
LYGGNYTILIFCPRAYSEENVSINPMMRCGGE